MRYRAVFFDAGETLVYPHPSFPELFADELAGAGLHIDPADVRARLPVIADLFAEAARRGELWSTAERSRGWWSAIYRAFFAALELPFTDAIAASLYETFTDPANYRLFPDVVGTLERLSGQGLTLGVISNFEEWLERLLESLDVTRFFDVRIISGVEGVEKPDPRIFHLALGRAGVEPARAVYVGDSPSFDVEPAASIGMFAVLIDRRDLHPDHDGVRLMSLDELPAAIGAAA